MTFFHSRLRLCACSFSEHRGHMKRRRFFGRKINFIKMWKIIKKPIKNHEWFSHLVSLRFFSFLLHNFFSLFSSSESFGCRVEVHCEFIVKREVFWHEALNFFVQLTLYLHYRAVVRSGMSCSTLLCKTVLPKNTFSFQLHFKANKNVEMNKNGNCVIENKKTFRNLINTLLLCAFLFLTHSLIESLHLSFSSACHRYANFP